MSYLMRVPLLTILFLLPALPIGAQLDAPPGGAPDEALGVGLIAEVEVDRRAGFLDLAVPIGPAARSLMPAGAVLLPNGPLPLEISDGAGLDSRAGTRLHPPAGTGLGLPFAAGVQQERDRTNLSLIAAGATLLVAGSFIDGSAGTVIMVTGSIFSAVGVYRWVR